MTAHSPSPARAPAVKRGNTLYHLRGDHLGSTSLTTRGSAATASRADYAYGAERSASGDLQTDRAFTGPKSDASGLLHYNARYYDPALGTFVSPDAMVPNPARVIEYHRFLYARGNPLKYADPSGHIPQSPTGPSDDHAESAQRYWQDRWHGARGYEFDPATGKYTRGITPFFVDMKVFTEMLAGAGITVENTGGWNFEDELKYLGQGIAILARTVAGSSGRLKASFAHLKTLVGPGVTWYRTSSKSVSFPCNLGGACAMEAGRIGFYGGLFQQGSISDLRGTAIHEFAHKIHLANSPCPTNHDEWCITRKWFTDTEISMADWQASRVTAYGFVVWENWAEGVTIWVYPAYKGPPSKNRKDPNGLTDAQSADVRRVLLPWP